MKLNCGETFEVLLVALTFWAILKATQLLTRLYAVAPLTKRWNIDSSGHKHLSA